MFAGITIYGYSDHRMDITIEFTLKNHFRTYITLIYVCWYFHIWLLQSQNRHHYWIHIKKPLQNIYNTYMFSSITIYGYSDHKMDITIKFISKNHFRTSWILLENPYQMISIFYIVVGLYNHYYHWILLEKWYKIPIHTFVFNEITKMVGLFTTLILPLKNWSSTYKMWFISVEIKSDYPNKPEVTYMAQIGWVYSGLHSQVVNSTFILPTAHEGKGSNPRMSNY